MSFPNLMPYLVRPKMPRELTSEILRSRRSAFVLPIYEIFFKKTLRKVAVAHFFLPNLDKLIKFLT